MSPFVCVVRWQASSQLSNCREIVKLLEIFDCFHGLCCHYEKITEFVELGSRGTNRRRSQFLAVGFMHFEGVAEAVLKNVSCPRVSILPLESE